MNKSFSSQLREEMSDVWEKIHSHPFIQELQAGTLPVEKFRYYVTQDFHYLEGFGRTVSIALSKAPDIGTLRKLSQRVNTPIERPLHNELFKLLELDEEEVLRLGASPTNQAYVNHMLRCASLGDTGIAAAALLPCPWTYHELGSVLSPPNHPIYDTWIGAYNAGLLEESTKAWRDVVDTCARSAGQPLREKMREAFITSSRYEYMFWSMAYNMETWPV